MKFYFDLMNLCRPNAASSISKTTDEGTKKKCCHFTAVQRPDFSAHLYFEMYIQCQLSNSPLQNVLIFFFNFASVIFFHLWFYIQRTKFILGESVSIVMNFILKILQTRILRNQSVFVVIHSYVEKHVTISF